MENIFDAVSDTSMVLEAEQRSTETSSGLSLVGIFLRHVCSLVLKRYSKVPIVG